MRCSATTPAARSSSISASIISPPTRPVSDIVSIVKSNLVVLAALLTAAPIYADGSQLKYVVIVSRHGVRSPTWDAARLREYSAEPWPDWGVPPGNLTPHGREAILKMGAYYREWLASEHLLSPKGCESASKITIYADKDQRTIETGHALAEALL